VDASHFQEIGESRMEILVTILLRSYLILVIMDSAITYIAIRYLGFIETWQSHVLFDYYGLTPGIVVSTAFCFSLAWLFWKARRFKTATYLGLSLLAITELAAVVNNLVRILS